MLVFDITEWEIPGGRYSADTADYKIVILTQF